MRVAILILELVRNAASFFFLSHFVKYAHIFWFLFHRAESTGWSRISWICASVFPKRKVCWLFRLEKKLADISLAYVVSSSREPLFLLVFHGRVLRLLTRSKSMTKFARRRYQLLLRSVSLCCPVDFSLVSQNPYSTKLSIPRLLQVLCKGHPVEFASYFHYCHTLTFDQRPDYGFLKRLFRDLFSREGTCRKWKW